MGMNMARRLLRGGHRVVAYNRTPNKIDEIVKEGATGAYRLEEVVEKLSAPRIVWLMLPAGPIVDDHLDRLQDLLSPGDIVVDGGNTYYKDDLRRGEALSGKDIRFMDAGVSGGIWGLEVGYCLMIGGPEETFNLLAPIFKTLAPKDGFLHCGELGAGHFTKMVHNGIEYGMMQACAEGFEILEASPYGRNLDYARIAHLWNQGSVIRSWLLELAEAAFAKSPELSDIRGYVEDSGEGRWTVKQAIETGVSAPVIALALMERFSSRKQDAFSDRVVAALRREFGGHAALPSDPGSEKGRENDT
jgi:6-phosphogluconate dehydrogenase